MELWRLATGHQRPDELIQDFRQRRTLVRVHGFQKLHVVLHEVVEDLSREAHPLFSKLEDHFSVVGCRGPFPHQPLLEKGLGEAARRALFKVKVFPQCRHGQGSDAVKGKEGLRLAHRKAVPGDPSPVPGLEGSHEGREGFLKPGCIPEEGGAVGGGGFAVHEKKNLTSGRRFK